MLKVRSTRWRSAYWGLILLGVLTAASETDFLRPLHGDRILTHGV